MANYQLLKADIDAKVYQNGKQEITGVNLNSVLNAMVTTLGAEYQFAGVATTATNPGTPDAKVFYIANGKGTYTNFGSLEVTEDEVVVLYWDTAWHKVATGIASQAKLSELEQEMQEKIDPGFFFEFRKRFIANGYYSSIDNYSCTSILIGDGSEYIFPSTSSVGCSYKIFQYISDSEGIEITPNWTSAELRYNINGKFIVTFNGQFTEQNKSIYEWLVANWRLGGYNVAIEPRMKFLEESAIVNMKLQSSYLIGNTKKKEIYVPLPEFYTKNLLNLEDSDVMLGYRQYSDTPEKSPNYNLSGYIPVESGKTYTFSTKDINNDKISYLAVFDKQRNFLRYESRLSTFTAQSDDYFVRLSLAVSAWNNSSQFELGSIATNYEKFGVQFKYPKIVGPEIVMPKRVYITKGIENSIYHKNYCNFLTDNFVISSYRNYPSATWKYLERCFRTEDTSQTLEILLHTKDSANILTQVSVATSVGNPTTDNGEINVLCIGDSFTYDGRYLQQIDDICPSINLIGMRKPSQALKNSNIRCEGRGGWTLADYFEPYLDITPSHMQPFSPFIHPNGYQYYGPTPFWAAIVNNTSQYTYGTSGFNDFASWFDTNGYKVNPVENDLMYDGSQYKYWNGSAWVAYTGTPNFVFDFEKYISVWNIPIPNIVLVFLGKNDFHNNVSQWSTFKENLDTLIDSIQAYNSNIVIGICTPTTADEAENNKDNRNAYLSHLNMWNARKLLIENYDSLTEKNIYIVDTGTTLDPDYGFVFEKQLPFAFYEGDERILVATNSVHPSGAGYKQIGTCMAGFIQVKR